MRYSDKPEDFSAVNSLFSAKFPMVMIEDKSIASGNAKGIKLAETKNKSSRITVILIPLPIKSSIYFQKNCMINMNMEIQKVTTNGPAKDLILKTYSRFKIKEILFSQK